MLNYHPVGDSYHCVFRLLLLTRFCARQDLEWERLRLMDFYFLFPHLIQTLRIPKEFGKYRKTFKAIPKPYEELTSPTRMYFKLGSIQESAVRSIIAKGYFDRELFLRKSLIRQIGTLSNDLVALIDADTKHEEEWFPYFLEVFLKTDLLSGNGLKARAGVMEHRYDAT